jgi:N4-gp56 family major capsid protein
MPPVQTTLLNGTGNDISPTIQTYYDKKLLDRLVSNFVHFQFGQKRPIPKMGGKNINFRKFTSLNPATTVLTEGTTPTGSNINITQITASPNQYGNFVEVSDVLDMVAIDPVLDEMADVLGEQAAETLDVITRNTLVTSGTNLQFANGKTSNATIAAADVLTVTEIRKAIRTLKNGKAKPLADGYYIAIVHPNAVYDLQGDNAWVNASQYAGSTQIFNGEIGKLYGVRFVESPNAHTFGGVGVSSAQVYSTIVVGANAFGVVDVAGSSAVQNIIKPHGSAGTADPLNQRATTGWKAYFTAVVLEQAAMVQIRHSASN